MPTNMNAEIAALKRMTPAQLRDKYAEVFGEPSRSGNKDFLFKRIAWRIQSLAEGDLSERARQRAAELARDADIRVTTPRMPRTPRQPKASTGTPQATVTGTLPRSAPRDRLPMPGTILTRQYRGRLIEATVLPKGFEWEGEVYRSLSAVAKAVTGSHWNGFLFFGLNNGDDQ